MLRSQEKGAQKLNSFWQPSWCSNAEYRRKAEVSISKNKFKQEHRESILVAQCSSSCGTFLDVPKAPSGRIQADAFRILFKLEPSKQAANKCFDKKNLSSGLLLFHMQFFFLISFLLVPCPPALIHAAALGPLTDKEPASSLDSHLFHIKGKRKKKT